MNSRQRQQELPRTIKLFDRAGVFVERIGRERAWDLVAQDIACFHYKAGKVKAAQLVEPGGRGRSSFTGHTGGRRYSHNRGTDTNPEGVWTLVEIPTMNRELFSAVVDDCMRRAA